MEPRRQLYSAQCSLTSFRTISGRRHGDSFLICGQLINEITPNNHVWVKTFIVL